MNRKNIFGFFSFIVIVAIAATFTNITAKESVGLSDVSLANVEALAEREIEVGPVCIQVVYDWCDITFPGDPYKEWMVPWKNVY